VSPQELISEAEILAVLARGEEDSKSVRERKGKPINLDKYFATPADVRMAFSILKGAELIPEELELLKEINRLEKELASMPQDDRDFADARGASAPQSARSALQRRISDLHAMYEMRMQSYQRKVRNL